MIDIDLFLPPLLAGLLVLSTHVPLGREVLRRGIIFVDLAVAQVAAFGVVFAKAAGWERYWMVQLAAIVAALSAAALLRWTERRWPDLQEALIGSLFVLSASLGLLLLALDPHGGEQLKQLLEGQILWTTYPALLPVAVVSALVLFAWWRMDERQHEWFYFLFAIVVTLSVQVVGVYLVFASLIIPALAVVRLRRAAGFWWAYTLGLLGYAAGLWLSWTVDLPAGPSIVCALTLCAAMFAMLASRFAKTSEKTAQYP